MSDSDTSDDEYNYKEDLEIPNRKSRGKASNSKGKLPPKKPIPKGKRGNGPGPSSAAAPADVEEEMAYDEALEILLGIHESVVEVPGSSQGTMRKEKRIERVKANWIMIVQAFEKESEQRGITKENLDKMIELFSSEKCYIPAYQGNRILLSLIPTNEMVDVRSIRKIVNFMTARPKIKGKDKLRKVMLKYLYGLYEYNLVDENIFYTPYVFSRLFSLTSDTTLINQACFFVKKISHKHLIQRSFILDLVDNLTNMNTKPAIKSILHLLRHFKLLRPDLAPNEVFKTKINSRIKPIDLPPEYRKKLFDAKSRLTGAEDLCYPFGAGEDGRSMELTRQIMNVGLTNRWCFPEFPLHMEGDVGDVQRWSDIHKRDFMRCSLKQTDTLPLLAKDEAALDYLSSYLYQIFRHKFENYDPAEHECYIFILHRCLQMTYLLGRGLDVVNDWLLIFLQDWDSYTFKGYVFELLKYMKPLRIKDHLIQYQKLRDIFIFGEDISRIRVFEVLGDLLISWTKDYYTKLNSSDIEGNNDEGEDSDNDENQSELNGEDLQDLLDFMNNLVTELGSRKGHEDQAFLIRCCNTYVKMMKEIQGIEQSVPNVITILPPITLWYMVVLSDSVATLDAFIGIINKKSILNERSDNATVNDWKTKVLPSFQEYLQLPLREGEEERPQVFAALFKSELKLLASSARNPENQAPIAAEIEKLMQTLCSFTLSSSSAKVILKDPSSNSSILRNINAELAKELMPNLVKYLAGRYGNLNRSRVNTSQTEA